MKYSLIYILLAIILFIYCYRNYKYNKRTRDQFFGEENQTYSKKRYFRTVTLEESVQFLYKIKNKIINSFTKSDKKLLRDIGVFLVKQGMTYNHVIEFGVSNLVVEEKIKSNTKLEGKETNKSR